MKISKEAYETFVDIHRQYVDHGRPTTSFGPAKTAEGRNAMNELRDAGLLKPFNMSGAMALTDLGKRGPSILEPAAPAVHVGDTINISNAHVGSVATRGSTATGTVTISNTVGESDVRAAVGDLQAVLDKVDDLDQKIYDFMSEMLLKVRKIQIEAGPKERVLAQLKEKLDDESVREEVARMKPSLAKLGTSVAQAAKHPLAPDVLALVVALADKVI